MRALITKIKPASGFSRLIHVGLNIFLVLLVFILVRIDFVQLALLVILLSKWRMFAVRPRFWPANIRANAVDIIVGVSLLAFMVHSGGQLVQIIWAAAYALWLLIVKPASTALMISVQATVGLLFGLTALFLHLGASPLYVLVLSASLICYLAARHFFDSFDEPYAKLLAYLWAYFGGALTWVLGHWLLFYGFMAQPTLLLVAIGYGLAAMYYLDHHERLSKLVRLEIMVTTYTIIVAVVASLTVNIMSTVRALLR
ncbi:MAG TPA: hypothetical protein VLE73_00910 [Candidatus Saccharimonadales bacterium]|nr:hypothetical protein [Candidatus Saccharimonadales bacterium]